MQKIETCFISNLFWIFPMLAVGMPLNYWHSIYWTMTMLYNADMTEWVRAENVDELKAAVANAMPPIPPVE